PNPFEESEVAGERQKQQQDHDGVDPLRRARQRLLYSRVVRDYHRGYSNQRQRHSLNRVVYGAGEKAIADRGERKMQRHALRRLNNQDIFICERRRHNPFSSASSAALYSYKPALSNLNQVRSISTEINFEITLRAPFTFNIYSTLFDQSARFGHR